MKLLTKNTDYAVRALLVLAFQEKYVPAKKIAELQGIPYQFLRGILQQLAHNELVETKLGPTGGVKLLVKPNDIKLSDLIEIFQGGIEFSDCLFRNKICQNRPKCVLRKELLRLEDIVKKEFDDITIGSLAASLSK